ncbi:hypothetical protein MAUB_16060 [Mycolicibacterium aubagnense]|uniref:Uncharacterized protein n=1 Tax=Mycolicibacterium aubagnense TaxID=319707 RepID=A0ABM7IAN6_9MYCO|nr:hypothetical protein MAUB_16060 [Mycolicibacterium aubagnense]
MGVGLAMSAKVAIHAGHVGLGGRLPARHLHIDLWETMPGSITSETGDAVCGCSVHVASGDVDADRFRGEPPCATW